MSESTLLRQSLDHCVKCTICETQCPVAAVTPLFPGPKYSGPQGERYRQPGVSVDQWIDYCSSCGICTNVCPQGVKIAEINSLARAEMKQRQGISLRDRVICQTTLMGRSMAPIAPLANWALGNRLIRRIVQAVIGIHRHAAMPTPSTRTLAKYLRRRRRAGIKPGSKGKLIYFHGCAGAYFEVETARKTIEILEFLGYSVLVPKQGCCGLPLQSNGLYPAARKWLARLARKLGSAGSDIPIIASSTSCGVQLKREGREILGVNNRHLDDVAGRTWDICEFLLDLHRRGELPLDFAPVPMTVPYHPPCQLRSHGIGMPALDLLRLIPGLSVVESNVNCCGMAGTYGIKKEKYGIAMDVGRPLFDVVEQMQPPVTVCDSETCRWHIAKATSVPVVHPVVVLHRAWGLSSV